MFEYIKNHRFFAQTQRRLEPIAREELQELGATQCEEVYCGIHFKASREILYRINYCARTIIRVLAPLTRFDCPSDEVLYKKAADIEWLDLLSPDQTFAVDSNVSDSTITHSRYAALRFKDAIVDYFRKKTGHRPNVNTANPDIRLNLNIQQDTAILSFDTSGGSLHKRGYRLASVPAPLQETLAAAIIRITGWTGDQPFFDPFCGSGTLVIEALMKYCRIPAGIHREHFGFFNMPDFSPQLWSQEKKRCAENLRICPKGLISGSDIDPKAVKASIRNLDSLPHGKQVRIARGDFRNQGKIGGCMVVSNPPYGFRLQPKEEQRENPSDLFQTYKELGDFLKQNCKGSTAYILCGDKELTKHIGLKISRRIPLFNGPIDSRLVKVELY